jgi:hypothetical protein
VEDPKVGDVWIAEIKGKAPHTSKNAVGDYQYPVRIEWVSTDARVVEGMAMIYRKRSKQWIPKARVTLARGLLVRKFTGRVATSS